MIPSIMPRIRRLLNAPQTKPNIRTAPRQVFVFVDFSARKYTAITAAVACIVAAREA